VAESTQNQALGEILILFGHVQAKDLGSLDTDGKSQLFKENGHDFRKLGPFARDRTLQVVAFGIVVNLRLIVWRGL